MTRLNTKSQAILWFTLIQMSPFGWGEDVPPVGQEPLRMPQMAHQWQKPNPLKQDVNGDGRVDVFDLVLVGGNFGKQAVENEPLVGDLTGDGEVDTQDLNEVGQHFGEYSWEVVIADQTFEVTLSSEERSGSL